MMRRLQRGPATKAQLVDAVLDDLGTDAYGEALGSALDKRFEADKRHLRDHFGLELQYRRTTHAYEISDTWEPLLDLPDDSLGAIAFLQETFGPGTPNHDSVQELLGVLSSYLSPERRGDLEIQRTALTVQWGQRDRDAVPPDVERGLQRAITGRRLVEFDYLSPSQSDGLPRRHIVEPWERYFDSVRGHYYLRGYCRQTTSEAHGTRPQRRYIHYRLGRMRNLHLLPDKLPPFPPKAPLKPLTYKLSPDIARRGDATTHPGINIQRTEHQDDGSLIVVAETEDVWWAVRTLLHYGPSCEILGGNDALYEVHRIVSTLAKTYGILGDSA